MDRNARHLHTPYRAFVVNDKGRLGGIPEIIEAENDRDAAQIAQRFAGWNAVELWAGARLVARVMPRQGHSSHPASDALSGMA